MFVDLLGFRPPVTIEGPVKGMRLRCESSGYFPPREVASDQRAERALVSGVDDRPARRHATRGVTRVYRPPRIPCFGLKVARAWALKDTLRSLCSSLPPDPRRALIGQSTERRARCRH